MCVLIQIEIEIEIVMAMTHRAYAQYVHIHGNKKIKTQGDKISDKIKRACAELCRLSLRGAQPILMGGARFLHACW